MGTFGGKPMNLAEQRNRFEIMVDQAQIPQDLIHRYFSKVYIEKVEVKKGQRQWTVYLQMDSIVPLEAFQTFCQKIEQRFAQVAAITFVTQYATDVSIATLVEEYWPLCLEEVATHSTSIAGMLKKSTLQVKENVLQVVLLSQMELEIIKKKQLDGWLERFFAERFRLSLKLVWIVDESQAETMAKFAEKRDMEEQKLVQDMMTAVQQKESAENKEQADQPVMLGYKIPDEPTPIQQIQEEERKITIQGSVFQSELRELRSGRSLITFNITDFTDSIQVKCFAKDKEDLKILQKIKDGLWLKVRGNVQFDTYAKELVVMANDLNQLLNVPRRLDTAEVKRVEFHAHSSMSTMDAISPVSKLIEQAAKWGHKAIAITDHANVQAYPEAQKAAKKHGIKVIYGIEANVLNDSVEIVLNPKPMDLKAATYVVFDVETTGLSVVNNQIIELAGVKMCNGQVIERFESFVHPNQVIPPNITELTGITNEMIKDAPQLVEVLPKFIEFVGDSVLSAHNARFDMGFLQAGCKQLGIPLVSNPALDTLELARFLFPSMKNHRLNTLAVRFKVSLDNHHRAVDDSEATGHILWHMIQETVQRDITDLNDLNNHAGEDLQNVRPFHCTIYAKNAEGKKNLYKLVSLSHTQYLHRVPRIPKSVLSHYREGLIVSSGCEKGELYETVLNKSLEEAEAVAQYYDVLEIQPHGINRHLVDKQLVAGEDTLKEVNRKIVQLGEKLDKPVIATGNVHYIDPNEKIYREILIAGITGFSPLKDQRKPDVHFRTTDEMLQEFTYLGQEKAYEVVVANTDRLADGIEHISIFPDKLFVPIMEGAEEEIREKCYGTAKAWYGDPLPDIVVKRLEKELVPIINYGFSANYLISERLVKKSNEDGYLVGSRGSVGSSFVATMLGISEVNPLPPHYKCPSCQHNEWFTEGEARNGFDLEDKDCPNCGETMKGDGHDIPFETFLGFKGDKVPDIDLNFSGEYQAIAHNYTKDLFGEKNVFRAGTIGTVADKTAFGFVKKYEEANQKSWRMAEISRLAGGCTGVKRSTGQHPGGIVVVPDYIEIEEVTPVQFPADDAKSEWRTTHFDYHAFEENLLKLDILGHDDPTMMRMLQDLTGVDPLTIPMNDPKVMSIFYATTALGVSPEQIRTPVATYGIPEMGTKFVRQMLEEAKPNCFADLLQISGLSHGTGVWLGNAQELIRNGTCTIKTVIGCRDEIMIYLIAKGMDSALAFKITESVRKGRGLTDEWIEAMKEHKVPAWYIESCNRIEYMFPKAHATAYVISAVRTAFFKIYHPLEYYATYFSVRADDFDVELCSKGYQAIHDKIAEIEEKGNQALPKEKSLLTILEMALEMTARGFGFKGVDLYRSKATEFIVDGDSLIPPFSAIQGVGSNAAKNVEAARADGEFLSVEDFQSRSKSTKTVIEILQQMGCFRGLPDTNQLSLF
jgi:DNA polymerase-3 subunit alpha (Gram-positive type)